MYELDFEDDSFDAAYAHQVLQHLSDPVAAIEEMLQRPYRWQALCFSVEQRVDVLGIAGVR